jgi:hypothetical protein
MRNVILTVTLLALAACELQPPPPKPAPAPASAAAGSAAPPAGSAVAVAPAPTAPTAPTAPPAPPAAPPQADVTPTCLAVGTHIADVLIQSAKDPSLRANYEQARTKVVRASAEACTTQSWSAEAVHCYGVSTVEADIRACEKKFPPPGGTAQPKRPSPDLPSK